MIELYTGTPGSGKSLHCAKKIYTRLKYGRDVIANFDINRDVFRRPDKMGRFTYVDNVDLTPDFLYEYDAKIHKKDRHGRTVEGQTLLIIDECQLLFNAREWQAGNRRGWTHFFTQHRKYGYNIILITQFDRLIDRQIRSLVEYEIRHRKVSNFKLFGLILGLLCGGALFVAIRIWYGIREKVDHEFFALDRKAMRLYDSYKIFNSDKPDSDKGKTNGKVTSADVVETQKEPFSESVSISPVLSVAVMPDVVPVLSAREADIAEVQKRYRDLIPKPLGWRRFLPIKKPSLS